MSKKYTYNYVKSFIEKEGYQLLSDDYINAHTKLLIKCSKGHEYKIKFCSFKNSKNRCKICFDLKRKPYNKLSFNDIKNYIESKGYQLLSDTYINAHTKLLIKCSQGHKFKKSYANITQNKGCPYCSGRKRYYNDEKKYIEKEGYQLLSNTLKGSLKFICPKGHKFNTTLWNFKNGQRCIHCCSQLKISKAEKELQNHIEALGYNIIRNDRTQIINPLTGYNLELDIWIPYLNKAIEYNGTYWHSKKDQMIKDQIKIDQCKEKDIDLLIVNEANWIKNKQREQKIIKNWLK